MAFMFIKKQIDINNDKWQDIKDQRAEAGRLGGIQRAINQGQTLSSKSKQCLGLLKNSKQNQANQANQAVYVNDNVNVYVNENENENVNVYGQATLDNNSQATPDNTHTSTSSVFHQVVACFNKVGIVEDYFKKNKEQFHFKETDKTRQLVQKLLDRGYKKEDIFDVIFLKYDQWIEHKDDNKIDMTQYYRPSTVLGDKFDEYYEEAKAAGIS